MDKLRTGNLFENIPGGLPQELFTDIAAAPGVRVERIVSAGHRTPEGKWYDQDRHEWVLLLKGRARLGFEHAYDLDLAPGDHVLIPAHCRHRVVRTAEDETTVWLAVHYDAGGDD